MFLLCVWGGSVKVTFQIGYLKFSGLCNRKHILQNGVNMGFEGT